MRILILGAGGIGGYFGGRLAEAEADVTFLVRPGRADKLTRDGLVVKSPLGDIQQPVQTLLSGQDSDPFDLVLLACKAYDLENAMNAVSPYLSGESAVLPLLNGVRHMEILNSRFGADRVLGGTCHIGVTLEPDGVIRHFNRMQSLMFGEQDGTMSARVSAFERIASQASFTSRASTHITQDLWDKLVFLATLAGATCLTQAAIGQIMRCADGYWLVTGLLEECRKLAEAAGHEPDGAYMERSRQLLTDKDSTFTASMLRDMQAGGPTEADHILGDLVVRAGNGGIEAPLLRTAYCRLQAHDILRQAG